MSLTKSNSSNVSLPPIPGGKLVDDHIGAATTDQLIGSVVASLSGGTTYINNKNNSIVPGGTKGVISALSEKESRAIEMKITIVIYFFLAAIIFSNFLVIIAYSRWKRLRTITNRFVLSLAIADLAVGLSRSMQEILGFMHPASTYKANSYNCMFFRNFPTTMNVASLLNLLGVTIDRFISVMHPLRYNAIMTERLANFIIILSWSLSFVIIFIVPHFLYLKPGRYFCTDPLYKYSLTMYFVLFVTILFTISLFYGKIFYECHKLLITNIFSPDCQQQRASQSSSATSFSNLGRFCTGRGGNTKSVSTGRNNSCYSKIQPSSCYYDYQKIAPPLDAGTIVYELEDDFPLNKRITGGNCEEDRFSIPDVGTNSCNSQSRSFSHTSQALLLPPMLEEFSLSETPYLLSNVVDSCKKDCNSQIISQEKDSSTITVNTTNPSSNTDIIDMHFKCPDSEAKNSVAVPDAATAKMIRSKGIHGIMKKSPHIYDKDNDPNVSSTSTSENFKPEKKETNKPGNSCKKRTISIGGTTSVRLFEDDEQKLGQYTTVNNKRHDSEPYPSATNDLTESVVRKNKFDTFSPVNIANALGMVYNSNQNHKHKNSNNNNNHCQTLNESLGIHILNRRESAGVIMGSKTTIMIAMIVGTFAILGFPIQLAEYWLIFRSDSIKNEKLFIILHGLCLVMYYSSSTVNPYIYAWKNKDFRKSFKRILTCSPKRRDTWDSLSSNSPRSSYVSPIARFSRLFSKQL